MQKWIILCMHCQKVFLHQEVRGIWKSFPVVWLNENKYVRYHLQKYWTNMTDGTRTVTTCTFQFTDWKKQYIRGIFSGLLLTVALARVHHIKSCHNIHALLHNLFNWSFPDSYSKTNVSNITAVLPSGFPMLHWSTCSAVFPGLACSPQRTYNVINFYSASMCTSQRTHSITLS